jgi:hypothetical protein
MIKWFLYIVLLMIFVPRLSSANNTGFHNFFGDNISLNANYSLQRDTIATKNAKHQTEEEKKKIKEIAKAKKLPKPEKVEEINTKNTKPKRQRRPDGLERPPEIPRRNNN